MIGNVVGGVLVASGQNLGDPKNGFTTEAANLVDYTYAMADVHRGDEFALFHAIDPWAAEVVPDAIEAALHFYDEFTPDQLSGVDLDLYKVVILDWDDHTTDQFATPYLAAFSELEDYVARGGVLWIQGGFRDDTGTTYALPFGGTATFDQYTDNAIVDPAHPIMATLTSPIVGNLASHASYTGLPAAAHVVARAFDENGLPVLYTLSALVFADGFEYETTGGWTTAVP